jgi:hypothetical protein
MFVLLFWQTPPQVVRDSSWRPEPDAPMSTQEVEHWRSEAERYLANAQLSDEAEATARRKKAAAKLLRVPAYRHAVALDAQLQHVLGKGKGIGFFQKAAAEDGQPELPLLARPCLVLHEDMHSVNLSAMYYALFQKRVRMIWARDEWHRVWNDMSLGCKHGGYSLVIKLVELVMNLSYGPWAGQKFFEEICDMAADYAQCLREDDPLLQDLAKRMQADMHQTADMSDGVRASLVQQLKGAEFLRVKGPHVSSTRWFDWMHGFKWWAPQWTMRYCILLFMGIKLGFLHRSDDADLLDSLNARASTNTSHAKPATTAQGKKDISNFRDKCKNSLHTCCVIMSDQAIQQCAMHILHCTSSHTEWYSKWSQKLRSRHAAKEFSVNMALGLDPLPAAHGIVSCLSDGAVLQDCGFMINEMCEMKPKPLHDGLLMYQDNLATNMDRLQWALLKQRVASLSQCMFAYPPAFAGLLSEVAEHRAWALKQAADVYHAHQHVLTSTLPFSKQACSRSFMQWTFNSEVFAALAAVGFQHVPGEVHELLTMCFSNIGGTLVCEIAFQKSRRAESERPDKMVNSLTAWHTPMKTQLLGDVFSFSEIVPGAVPEEPRAGKANLPDSLFNPQYKQQSMDLRGICGVGKARYPSFTPDSARIMVEELQLMCQHMHDMSKASRCWRSQFLHPGLLVWKVKPVKESILYFSMGAFSCSALLWPAVVTKVGTGRVWGLQPIASAAGLRWVSMSDFDEWMCLPTEPISPAHMRSLNGNALPASFPPTSRLQVEKRPVPLLKEAARKCFWKMKADLITQLGEQELEIAFAAGAPFPVRLLMVVMHVLDISEEAAAGILEQRCFQMEIAAGAEEVLMSGEAHDAMTADAQKATNELLESLESQGKKSDDMAKFISELRAKRGSGQRLRAAVKFPGESERPLVEESFKQFLPTSQARLFRDQFNGRWRAFYGHGGKWSCSKSWGTGREYPCVLHVLRAIWKHHTAVTGEACHIMGLMV